MARLPDPTGSLSPDGQALYEELKGTRGRIDGMYRCMLNNLDLTRHVSALGSYIRFQSAFPPDVRELAILYIARRLGAGYEWVKHEPCARAAGVPDDVIEGLRSGRQIAGEHAFYPDIIQAVDCVIKQESIPPELQGRLVDRLGTSGLVELVMLTGYYVMIAGVIFAFEVPLPEGSEAPF